MSISNVLCEYRWNRFIKSQLDFPMLGLAAVKRFTITKKVKFVIHANFIISKISLQIIEPNENALKMHELKQSILLKYRQISNIRRTNSNFKRFLSRLAVIFTQSIEARY